MLCKNKKCNKGNFGKRCKFDPNGTQVYCCTDCLLEDMQTERYKKEVSVKIKKEANEQTKRIKVVVYERENKKYLQNEINKLARMIDARFEYDTCICCHRGFGAQTDGAHYHSVGSNHTLRYNLHQIHSASSYCNDFSNTHISGYKDGLERRYGKEYQVYVVNELPLLYKGVHLSAQEIADKLVIVRKAIREFSKMKFSNSIQAREELNKLIGIY
jgi:ribosome-binding protein aMBF1 (putative translation factor)